MELHLKQETETKLNELAERTHRGTDELLEEAVEHLVTYNEWFEGKVKDSLAAAEQGEMVCDEEVSAWLEKRERARNADRMVGAPAEEFFAHAGL